MADLVAIRGNVRAALDAGCDDLHQCATWDRWPLPFIEIATRKADASLSSPQPCSPSGHAAHPCGCGR